jgi:hypothetical protein
MTAFQSKFRAAYFFQIAIDFQAPRTRVFFPLQERIQSGQRRRAVFDFAIEVEVFGPFRSTFCAMEVQAFRCYPTVILTLAFYTGLDSDSCLRCLCPDAIQINEAIRVANIR